MPTGFTQQNQRFRPSSKEDQVVQKAREHFERTLIQIRGELAGSVAALEHPRHDEALNYGEIFLRDNVPVMIYLLLQGRYPVVKQFLSVCLDLQSTTVQTRGVFPTSFVEEEGDLVADSVLALRQAQRRFRIRTQSARSARAATAAGPGAPSELRRHTGALCSGLRLHD